MAEAQAAIDRAAGTRVIGAGDSMRFCICQASPIGSQERSWSGGPGPWPQRKPKSSLMYRSFCADGDLATN